MMGIRSERAVPSGMPDDPPPVNISAGTFPYMRQRNPERISVAMGVAAETADSNQFLIKVRENSVSSSDGLTALNYLTDVPEFQTL